MAKEASLSKNLKEVVEEVRQWPAWMRVATGLPVDQSDAEKPPQEKDEKKDSAKQNR
mgnify:CR=1 FL=1